MPDESYWLEDMDDARSTSTGTNPGASNASDFQPLTQNPQNDVSTVQSTQGLQAPSSGFTQESLVDNGPLQVVTENSTTTLVPRTEQPEAAEVQAEIITFLLIVAVLLILGFFLRRRRRSVRHVNVFIENPTEDSSGSSTEFSDSPSVIKAKKKPKTTKARPRKKFKTRR